MEPTRIFEHFCEQAQRYGTGAALHDIGCRAMHRIARLQILRGMAVRVQDVPDPAFFDACGLEARFAVDGELEPYARDNAHELTMPFIREARARGDRCYALFDGRDLAAYGWYSEAATPLNAGFVLHFDDAYTYMYKGYTVPAYRGRRLHAVAMCRALQAFTDAGKKGLISWVLSNNFASMRSVLRMGYRIFGSVYLLRDLGWTWSTPGCRAYAFGARRVETVSGCVELSA